MQKGGGTLPTAEEITSWYLWGSNQKPDNLIDPDLIRDSDAVSSITVSAAEYMSDTGPGRFVNPASFQIVRWFFVGDYKLNPGEYDEPKLRGKLNITEKYISFRQWNYRDKIDDYIERIYIWNSSVFEIEDSVRFVINEDGSRYIKNLAVIPLAKNYNARNTENFDFESSDWLASAGRAILEPLIDPSRIGRRVDIYFETDIKHIAYYDFDDYKNDLKKYYEIENQRIAAPDLFGIKNGIEGLSRRLFDKSNGVNKFIQNGKVVVYADVDGGVAQLNRKINKYHKESAVNNGIIFVGSNQEDISVASASYLPAAPVEFYGYGGDDSLTGDQLNDKLYGGEGDDKLYGLAGDDQLYGEAGDDILDGGKGNDLIDGGEGSDTVSYEGAKHGVKVFLDTDALKGAANGDVLRSIENIIGSQYKDELCGDAMDDTIVG